MEEIYVNAEYFKSDNPIPSTRNCKGPRSSKRSFYSGVTLSLGLLSVLLLIGLITLGVYLHDSTASLSATSSKLSSMTEERDLLMANVSAMRNKLSSVTEERDLLMANVSAMRNKLSAVTEERDHLMANVSAMRNKLSSVTEERDHLMANVSAMRNKLSSVTEERDHLMANLSAMRNKLSSVTEERDHLNARLTEKTKELERLQSLSKQNKACPAGWSMFSCSCYLLSERSDSWDAARKDCRDRGADLVVIDSSEEQMFLATVTKGNSWIGLNDKEREGQWKWVDGTPLIWSNWMTNEPNNAGDEDCVHMRTDDRRTWNDCKCSISLTWVCEKIP